MLRSVLNVSWGMSGFAGTTMERLWTPWRLRYVAGDVRHEGCVFCAKPAAGDDVEHLILYRGERAYLIMNLFPYNTGHVMVVPFQHAAELSELDPAYLVHGPWGLWPQDEPYLNLRELREYFLRLPQLPFLEQDEVLKNAILQGIRIHLFELGVKGSDGFTQVWDASRPPGTEQVFFGEAYVLARPGKLPRPGSEPGHSTDTNENEDLDQDEPVSPPNNGSDKKTVKTKVRVTLEQLELSRIPTLVDLAKSLRDAGGTVQLRVEIEATSPKGLDEGVLNTSAKEILDQHGLKYEWHEE